MITGGAGSPYPGFAYSPGATARSDLRVTFFWSSDRDFERLPFLMALALFLLGFLGLGVSMYPYIVPRAVTIWDAAAPPESRCSCWSERLSSSP